MLNVVGEGLSLATNFVKEENERKKEAKEKEASLLKAAAAASMSGSVWMVGKGWRGGDTASCATVPCSATSRPHHVQGPAKVLAARGHRTLFFRRCPVRGASRLVCSCARHRGGAASAGAAAVLSACSAATLQQQRLVVRPAAWHAALHHPAH